ncbi:MAG: universal stress protein [Candidatus Binatia bacterium]|nr:universal stress protein [Candidatus Binatia bacterium]
MSKVSYQRIVVAVDFSKTSKAALQQALGVAEQHDATLEVIYVIEDAFQATLPWMKQGQETVKQMRSEAVDVATEKLQKFVGKTAVEVRRTVKTGEVDEEVIRLAGRRKADLIVLGKVGRRRVDEFLIGSSANDIIRISTVPVLLVPAPKKR